MHGYLGILFLFENLIATTTSITFETVTISLTQCLLLSAVVQLQLPGLMGWAASDSVTIYWF